MSINKYNPEHYYDPTAYDALKRIEKTEKQIKKQTKKVPSFIKVKLIDGKTIYCKKLEFLKTGVLIIKPYGYKSLIDSVQISCICMNREMEDM